MPTPPPLLHASQLHPFNRLDVPTLLAHRGRGSGATTRSSSGSRSTGLARRGPTPSFTRAVGRVAGGLARRGVRAGERVLIHLDNCPETLLAWYACGWLGAVAVTTNARAADDELAYYAEHCGAVAAITQPKFAEAVARNCRHIRWQVVTDTDNGTPPAQPVPADQRFATLDAEPPPRRATRPLGAVQRAVHQRHHQPAQGCAVDPCQRAVGRAHQRRA